MTLKTFFKPSLHNLIISPIVALIPAILMYFYKLNRPIMFCQALGCPTARGVASDAALWMFGMVLIASYLIICTIDYFRNRDSANF